MRIRLNGDAQEVTGSCTAVEAGRPASSSIAACSTADGKQATAISRDRSAREEPPQTAGPAAVPCDRDDGLSEQDRIYYLARAEEELELAQHSRHPKVVQSHYMLASLYLDRVYGRDPLGGGDK